MHLLASLLVLSLASATQADTFTVLNLNDSGPGSLRQAIFDANANAGPDTIEFDVPGTITLSTGQLVVNDDLTIDGSMQPQVVVDGNGATRVFRLAQATVALEALTIFDGAPTFGQGPMGGGILNMSSATTTLTRCWVVGNAALNGGGLLNEGSMTLEGCTVSGNFAAYGGGIDNRGSLSITNSTVSANRAEEGAGIANLDEATVTCSTIGGNEVFAQPLGAGIRNRGSLALSNSIVADNTLSVSGIGNDCSNASTAVFNDDGYNIIEDGSCLSHPTSMSGDPHLGPLASNGGRTWTHALLAGSIAIDAGDCAGGTIATDQRGLGRPFGAACDIGAFELQATCFTLDFETDSSGSPIPHGARIDDEFSSGVFPLVEGSAVPSGLNTAAVLNSDTGPAAQDPDLLVGSGNVLILQTDAQTSECPPESGVYCTHNDDEDGGTLSFSWPDGQVVPQSLALIDNDSSDGTWSVVLSDAALNQRTYTVPAGWTGDFAADGPQAGRRTLDLSTLEDQVGFASTATAVEDLGFDPNDVTRITVLLNGSGALDDLTYCVVAGLPRARIVARNGMGLNEISLSSDTPPRIGNLWSASLDCGGLGGGLASLSVRRNAVSGTLTPLGERLIAGQRLFESSRPFTSSPSPFTLPIPHDMALVGLAVHAQGSCRATTTGLGPKALGLRGGLSNALDLTLGF